MAETKKNTNAAEAKRVQVKLPRLSGQNAVQEEFFSVNGRNYIIKRGEYVDVPEEVAEVIRNSEREEECAMRYIESLKEAEKAKSEALK